MNSDTGSIDAPQTTEDVRKVAELASGIPIGMMTTIDEDGTLVSRPMAQQEVEFDGDLWFFAERDSRKVRHLQRDPHLALTLTSSSTWLSLDGTGVVVHDVAKAKELWNAGVEAWLPQGPEDPSVVLIKMDVATAQYWNTPGGLLATVFSFVKSKVTGERYDGGEEGTVRMG